MSTAGSPALRRRGPRPLRQGPARVPLRAAHRLASLLPLQR